MNAIRTFAVCKAVGVTFTADFKHRFYEAFKRREAEGVLTRASFARECSVSGATVTRWLDLRSPVTPELKKLPIVCRVLGVTASYLIHGDSQGVPPPNSARIRKIAREAADLAREVADLLDDEDKAPVPLKGGSGKIKPN